MNAHHIYDKTKNNPQFLYRLNHQNQILFTIKLIEILF